MKTGKGGYGRIRTLEIVMGIVVGVAATKRRLIETSMEVTAGVAIGLGAEVGRIVRLEGETVIAVGGGAIITTVIRREAGEGAGESMLIGTEDARRTVDGEVEAIGAAKTARIGRLVGEATTEEEGEGAGVMGATEAERIALEAAAVDIRRIA